MNLPRSLTSRGITLPVLCVAAVWVACVACLAFLQDPPTTTCLFKRITGYPCATCGSTRALTRLAHADIPGALSMNPLVTLFMLAAPVALLVALTRPRLITAPGHPIRSHALLIAGLVLLACNWAYLIWQNR